VAELTATALRASNTSSVSGIEKVSIGIMAGYLADSKVAQVEIIGNGGHGVVLNPPAVANETYLAITMALEHPWSRGTVHINSVDATASPVIDPRYLTNEYVFINMVKLARKIATTAPLGADVAFQQYPDPSIQSDADIETFIRNTSSPIYHPIGTAALGPEDWGGVVDENLLVYGTNNLRIVDASIIPLHIAAHLQQTVYAIAETAVDIIAPLL